MASHVWAKAIFVALVLFVLGCSSEDHSQIVVEESPQEYNEIYFSANIANTKALDLSEFSVGDQIGVWVCHDTTEEEWEEESLTSEFFNNECLTATEFNDSFILTYDSIMFWPEEGTLRSFAYYPYSKNVTNGASYSSITFPTIQSGYPSITYKPATRAERQEDFVTAIATSECNGDGGYINLAFRHQLAKLSFTFAHDFECDDDKEVSIKIHIITINNVKYYSGSFTDSEYFVSDGTSTAYTTSGFVWDNTIEVGSVTMISGYYYGVDQTKSIARYDEDDPIFTEVLNSDGAFMIHPQTVGSEDSEIAIEYYLSYGGTQGTATVTKTSVLSDLGVTLTKGVHTTIRLVLTPDEIMFDGFDVEDWLTSNSEDDSSQDDGEGTTTDSNFDVGSSLDGANDWGDPNLDVSDWSDKNINSEI